LHALLAPPPPLAHSTPLFEGWHSIKVQNPV